MSRRIWMYYWSGIYDGCDLAIKTLNTLCTSIWLGEKILVTRKITSPGSHLLVRWNKQGQNTDYNVKFERITKTLVMEVYVCHFC